MSDLIAQEFRSWARKQRRPDDDPEPFEAGWQLGAWHALRNNTDLGLGFAIQNLRRDVRALTETIERLERIAAQNRDAEIDAELEAQSAYWHSEEVPS
jgi:hypothetical protein